MRSSTTLSNGEHYEGLVDCETNKRYGTWLIEMPGDTPIFVTYVDGVMVGDLVDPKVAPDRMRRELEEDHRRSEARMDARQANDTRSDEERAQGVLRLFSHPDIKAIHPTGTARGQ